MRLALLATVACLIASPALATGSKPVPPPGNTQQQNQQQLQAITNNVSGAGNSGGGTSIRALGLANGGLTSSGTRPIGSFQTPIFGSTYGVEKARDMDNADTLERLGHTRAAMALRCMDGNFRTAMKFERTTVCPQDEPGAASASAEVPTITRKTRLGRQ